MYKQNELGKFEILKSILTSEEYQDFKNTITGQNDIISNISIAPIENYISNIITDREEVELLKCLYQNIRYYLNAKSMYGPKLEEGMAIVISKALVSNASRNGRAESYFELGDRFFGYDICNPYEETARLLLLAIKREYYESHSTKNYGFAHQIRFSHEYLREALNTAMKKDGVKSTIRRYSRDDLYERFEKTLENSDIDANSVISATTKDNRDTMLEILNQIEGIYEAKLHFNALVTGSPTDEMYTKLQNQFSTKITYAKRNIGIYEKTKRLVKMN